MPRRVRVCEGLSEAAKALARRCQGSQGGCKNMCMCMNMYMCMCMCM